MRSLKNNNLGYIRVVGSLVALLITIILGVLIFWQVADSIEMSSSEANASKNETLEMASVVFNLLPLIALVVVAAVILGIVLAFGQGPQGGRGV